MHPNEFDELLGRPAAELVWPGKSRSAVATTPAGEPPTLRIVERYGGAAEQAVGRGAAAPWRSALVHGDNLALLTALRSDPWPARIAAAGGLRVVYLDPPFLTGQELFGEVRVGTTGLGATPRVARLPAFRDAGPRDLPTYLSEMRSRLILIRDLLADDGSLYLHCDHRLNAYLRLLLDEIFGPDRFVNEIIWHYGLGNPGGARSFARKHDTILLYAKTDRYRFHRLRGEVTRAMANKYRHEDEHGRYMLAYGRKYRLKGGKPFDSVWEIPTLAATDRERLGYPTQKPEALLERIIRASSDPGDLVADLCAGCGTLPAVATRLGRRWLACDRGQLAIHLSRTRLLALDEWLRAAGDVGLDFDLMSVAGSDLPRENPAGCLRYGLIVEVVPTGEGVSVVLRDLHIEPDANADAIGAATRPGRGTLTVESGQLVRLSYDRDGGFVRTPLTDSWSDWLETWAVEFGSGDPSFFRVDWVAFRGSGRRDLPLASPPLDRGAARCGPLRVRATTVLADEVTVSVPLVAGGDPKPDGPH